MSCPGNLKAKRKFVNKTFRKVSNAPEKIKQNDLNFSVRTNREFKFFLHLI